MKLVAMVTEPRSVARYLTSLGERLFQASVVMGPALGGAIYAAFGPLAAYMMSARARSSRRRSSGQRAQTKPPPRPTAVQRSDESHPINLS